MSSIGIAVLAAGASSRLGQPKQLVSFRGETLLRHTVNCALAASNDVVVVSGALHEVLETELYDLHVRVVHNPDWATGMSSSVKTGLLALPANTHGIMFLVCDQPMIGTDLIREMAAIFSQDTSRIVSCKYGDTYGTPVIFPNSQFPNLTELTGPEGAKKVIKANLDLATFVDFPEGLLDIDTPEQLRILNQNNSF